MKASEEQQITNELQSKPYHLDPVDAVPTHRPRLCWCSEPLEGALEGLEFQEELRWTRVTAQAEYPLPAQWIEPDHWWPGGDEGWVLPTCVKAIVRKKPPVRPAGIDRCSKEALARYEADEFRYPPYQYQNQYIFYSSSGKWRTAGVEEKELLMGYGWKHTYLCYSASKIKQNYQQYDDERNSLLGDSFSLYSFIIPAAALCRRFLPRLSYRFLALRMGLAPGFRSPIRLLSPLARTLQYGDLPEISCGVDQLNRLLLSRTNHTGSDIRISTGEILNPKAHPRQSVEASWWNWEHVFNVRWKAKDHINLLELRSIFLSVQYYISHRHSVDLRIFHVADSYVCLSIIGKGGTSSRALGNILKQLNAYLLVHNLYLILGHVESTENPTDGASRAMEI